MGRDYRQGKKHVFEGEIEKRGARRRRENKTVKGGWTESAKNGSGGYGRKGMVKEGK